MTSGRLFVVLVFLGAVVFGNSLTNPFHFDDHHSIEYNPHIRSLARIPDFFVDPSTFSSRARGYMFRPALLTTYAVDEALWDGRVWGYRLTNLLLHAGTATLFGVWVSLLSRRRLGLTAGLLFLVHPAHAEVVNYLSSRSDVLAGLLLLAAFVALWQERRVAGVAAYAGALLAKSVSVALPVLYALSRWLRGASLRGVGTWAGLTVVTLAYLAALSATRFLQASAGKLPRPWAMEWLTQAKAPAFYAWLYASPVQLNIDHAFRVEESPGSVTTWLALLLGLSVLVVAWRGRRGVPAAGVAWFVVALGPYLLIPLNILVAERRTYAAGCGLLLVGLWAWEGLGRRMDLRPLGIAAAVVLSLLTVQRNEVWASHVSVWSDAVAKNPHGARARLNLALAHHRAGEIARAEASLDEGLRIDPDFAEAWVLLGELRQERGDLDGAKAALERGAALDPTLAGVHHNLGNVAMALGQGAARRGDGDAAQQQFAIAEQRYRRTLELDPRFAEARNNLGQALEGSGRTQAACAEYRRAIADSIHWVHTDDPVGGAWYNLGRCAAALGQRSEARHAFARAAELLGSDPRWASYAQEARRQQQLQGAP